MSLSSFGKDTFRAATHTDRSQRLTTRERDETSREHQADLHAAPERDGWIGVDFAHLVTPPSSRSWVPLIVLALLVALGISALRIDLIRTRYALAETMASEKKLIQDQRDLIVRQRRLRDPAVLTALARERGFRPIGRARTLTDPMPMDNESTRGLPAVAAGPPSDSSPRLIGAIAP